ncbi:DNA-directed RNA polymerase, mitochondrial [Neocloeon triangulifer]|uniref:DNA-directed RNA polymerase, mitochondrial n=1 Tax=Neocloeon triangulifer TaxID=2078957 RepID=UPI00286EE4EE|nr:DNA-directed RNA polymerase, mitochondrial [Neocloeon triangulifer]
MYRILKSRNFSYCKIKTISSFVREETFQKLCSHCNAALMRLEVSRKPIHTSSFALQSPEAKSDDKKQATKQNTDRANYAEILSVYGNSSKETRQPVGKMKVNKLLKNLESNTEKKGERNKEDEASISTLDNTNQDLVTNNNNAFEIHIKSLTNLGTIKKSSKSAKKADKSALVKNPLEDQEFLLHTESTSESLLCYLDVCVSCGFLNKAFSVFNSHVSKHRQERPTIGKLTNINLYNTLLRGYAGRGNFDKVCELMDIMKYEKLNPNVHSYIACFECVGRVGTNFRSDLQLREWLRQMTSHGINMQSLFDSANFLKDQREMVLKSCLLLDQNFVPKPKAENMGYSCPLLKDLDPQKLENPKRLKNVLTAADVQEKAAIQFNLEREGSVMVKSVENNTQPAEVTNFYRATLAEQLGTWKKKAQKAFYRELQSLQQTHNQSLKMTIYPFLKILPADDYVDIILREIRNLAEGSESYSNSMHLLYKQLGSEVMGRYQALWKTNAGITEMTGKIYQEYCNWFAENNSETVSNPRVKWMELMQEFAENSSVQLMSKVWPNYLQLRVGKFLYKIILCDIQIDVHLLKPNFSEKHILPAFYSLYRCTGKFSREEVKPHPVVSKLFRGAAPESLQFSTSDVPMLSPPVPWTSIRFGGYLIKSTEIVRLPLHAYLQWNRMDKAPVQQIYPAFDSLNQLGSIPWKVNEPMLDVILKVFTSGGSSKLDVPEPPTAFTGFDQTTAETAESVENKKYEVYKQQLAVRRHKAEMYSLWCDALYKLSLANHYRKDIFWFPHNMDFRGRVYPCSPHLNHLGSDLARSILCFAKGEPLGKHGLDWLKIHVINLTGLKKKNSKADRLKYANEMMPEILDSADNPVEGRQWWMESDEPWQTLAACMEISNAVRSPNPENYVSSFPIHQDGSCNGLQHYAALGRDTAGALSVNLSPADIPQDVYSCVVALVEQERAEDAAKGVQIAQVLNGFVERKVIKQTVMTTVYGVTRYGARLQIAKQLKDLDNFPKDMVWQASSYLSSKTFASLGSLFTSAKEIQDWLTDCARLISRIKSKNVEWVTPLGLPVVQPYIKETKAPEMSSNSSTKYIQSLFNMDSFSQPNTVKQKNAFPPNFIHSLDSSHMMLTSLHCEQKGITFASVHDCFWTHPSTVDKMNEICRKQFVALHSQPILEDLSKFLFDKFGSNMAHGELLADTQKLNDVLLQVPPKGDFDLSKVLKSIYFFS